MPHIKQVIVVIKKFPDGKGGFFGIRRGKEIAQSCHASIAFLLEKFKTGDKLTEIEVKWIEQGQPKIVLCVDGFEEYDKVFNRAKESGLTVHRILDSAKTEFKEPTYIALAIGPNLSKDIDKITSDLKLY